MLKTFARIYLTIGVCSSVVTAVVLTKDGKDTPSKIAYYATVNGVLWPLAVITGAKTYLDLQNQKEG